MKDIGIKLKEKREANGVSIEEAAEDMKMRPSQIESLEAGRKEDFKDVGMLKLFIRDYAKYLGLDGEKMIDDFNEFLFDFTSKIPLSDINKANTSKKKEVASPYTKVSNKSTKYRLFVLAIIFTLILGFIGYIVIDKMHRNDFLDNNTTYVISRR